MKNFAPFLKLYTEYVKNFDNAMNIISAMAAKYQRFAAVMDEIHVSRNMDYKWSRPFFVFVSDSESCTVSKDVCHLK
jgi:hypothetical protein